MGRKEIIYLDNAATTGLDPKVIEAMDYCHKLRAMNASSSHKAGLLAALQIEKARALIADEINANPNEIVFTSGGTESANLALKGIAWANADTGRHIITTRIEHPCVLESARWLEKNGFEVTYLPVDSEGFVDPASIEKAIKKGTILVSIIHGHNEFGTLQPLGELREACRQKGINFHTDACQSFTKSRLDVKKDRIDLISINAHKIHGPRGVGALYVREGVKILPLLHGGGQEHGYRSGTYNTEGIAGFGKACEIASWRDIQKMTSLREYFLGKIYRQLSCVSLNGPKSKKNRLCNNINLTFKSHSGKKLAQELDKLGICVSAGSACAATKLSPSHSLLALGLSPKMAFNSLRIVLNKWNTKEEVDYTAQKIAELVAAKEGHPYGKNHSQGR